MITALNKCLFIARPRLQVVVWLFAVELWVCLLLSDSVMALLEVWLNPTITIFRAETFISALRITMLSSWLFAITSVGRCCEIVVEPLQGFAENKRKLRKTLSGMNTCLKPLEYSDRYFIFHAGPSCNWQPLQTQNSLIRPQHVNVWL